MPDYLPSGLPAVPRIDVPVPPDARRSVSPDAFGSAPEEGLDWRRYLSAVLRYRWWILVLTVLGAAAGVGSARLVPPRYQAQATIWIQASEQRGGGGGRGPIGAGQLFVAYAWVDLLRSYVVLDEVARDLRLYLRPQSRHPAAFATFLVGEEYRPGQYRVRVDRTGSTFRLEGADGVELQHGAVGDSVGQGLGFQWAPSADVLPPGSEVAFTVRPLRDAAKGLGDALGVAMDENGNFLSVKLTGNDPARVAMTINAVARRYVTVATELKRVKLSELARLLSEQLAAAGADLERAESAYEAVRVRTITVSPELGAGATQQGGGQGLGDFFSLRLEQERLRRDREAIERVLARMRDSSGSAEGLAFIGAVQRSADLSQALRELTTKRAEQRALRYGYTDDHPSVRRVTDEIEVLERTTIPGLARMFVADLAARERVLAPQIAGGSRDLRSMPQRAIEEARLRRDMDMAANLYIGVQQRYDEARLAEASSVADVRILDAAVAPQEPLKDTASRHILVGFAAGLGLGLLGAVLADRFDPRMRYPDQVTRQMGLPILGVLPHLKNRRAGPNDEHVLHLVEAMRSLRLNLAYAYGAAGPLLATVTSPGMGDGKSFVAANLAMAYAEAGERTLLIDGDTRRGTLHRALHVPRKPGLTDVLAGRVSLEAVTRSTSCPSLHIIGAGTRFRDSPELLASPEMIAALTRLRSSYRVILVDSPPLGSGVDPFTLGTLTGSVLLVMRTGATNLELTKTQLAMLDRLPIRQLGVVLNDVPPGGAYQYYSYISGYGPRDEGEGFALPRRQLRGAL